MSFGIASAIPDGDDWIGRELRELRREMAELRTARTLQTLATSAVKPVVVSKQLSVNQTLTAGDINIVTVSVDVPDGYARALVTGNGYLSLYAPTSYMLNARVDIGGKPPTTPTMSQWVADAANGYGSVSHGDSAVLDDLSSGSVVVNLYGGVDTKGVTASVNVALLTVSILFLR